jgi:hypothetical protein
MGSIRIHQLYIDVCRYNVSCFGTEEVYVNDMDCDMFKDMGRNISIPPQDRTQPFTSAFEEDPMWYIGESKNVDPESTACQHINACHPKAPPAPDPVKLDPNHSPLGGETTSTPVSKFSSDLYYDAVDRDPSVKRFFLILLMEMNTSK